MNERNKLETFVLSNELARAVDVPETEATYKALEELGIHHPPYSKFMLVVDAAYMGRPDIALLGERHAFNEGRGVFELEFDGENCIPYIGQGKRRQLAIQPAIDMVNEKVAEREYLESLQRTMIGVCAFWRRAFIVLLATKYVRKTREVDKLAKLGIGKNKGNPLYRTTLSLARVDDIPESEKGTPTRRHYRPHMRRGHIRNQHWGPNLQFTKRVFIEAIFVNSDRAFVSPREYYNVIKGVDNLSHANLA